MRALALAALMAPATALADCGEVAGPCEIDGGSYHVQLPADASGPVPAIVFLHGWGASGEGMLRMGLADAAGARGWAFVAPDGVPREGRPGRSWSFHPERREGRRDERAFLADVMADAAERHGIDPDRTILGGFSIGGSMASYVACEGPGDFAAFAPVGGAFWRPHPEGCAGPVRLIHTHGWRDMTVPLEGRIVGSGFGQGDVFQSLQIWREANGCDNFRATAFETEDDTWRRRWTECAPGTALELVLFDGAHGVPQGWADMTLDWFEGLEAEG